VNWARRKGRHLHLGRRIENRGLVPYMLNTRNEETNTVFDSDLACFVNTFALNMHVSMSYTGSTRRNTVFIFLWLRYRNTSIPIQHVGLVQFSLYKILFHFKALLWESIILVLPPPHLQSLPYCNTIAPPLRNMRPPSDPPFIHHAPYKIGNGNIV